jgi:hypothetical protein
MCQTKVTSQQINGLVHDKASDGLRMAPSRVPLLSRCVPLRGVVHLRQTFVRRRHCEKRPQRNLRDEVEALGLVDASSVVRGPTVRTGVAEVAGRG